MTDTNGNDSNGKPAPHCPVCHVEMTLTIEHRDDPVVHDVRVWVCPTADRHPLPPPGRRWWTEPPFDGLAAP